MPSFATVTPTNLQLSPAQVTFNGVDLGGTLGNVLVSTKFVKANLLADQYGKTVLDRRVSALDITVTTELAEVLNKDIWKVVFPHANEITSGTKLMQFVNAIGDSDLSHAQQLVLHPLARSSADFTEDYTFYKACASAESEIMYSPDGQAKLKIVWNILPDTSVSPAQFFIYGDPSVGIVHAAVGTVVYSGTGNGTMTNKVAFDGFTKTETITAVCLHPATGGGVFYVSGSISGPLGLATVDSTFTCAQISFKINHGSTDFIYNDTFTIPTTGANFA